MKRSPVFSVGAVLLISSLWVVSGFAATSTALSNRTRVDTRDSSDVIRLIPKLTDEKNDGRRLISYQTDWSALNRIKGKTGTMYLRVDIPRFSIKKSGWGKQQAGLGAYYGLEMRWKGASLGDSIQYKVGGADPSDETPASEWISAKFNSIINIPLTANAYFFKIKVAPVSDSTSLPLKVRASYKSARLCDKNGDPVKSLNSNKALYVIGHGKIDGENSFRSIHKAVRNGGSGSQVVSLDWASGADGSGTQLSNGRYFINLGKTLSKLLKKHGFATDKVSWVGHSWGTLVGYESARAFGGVDRFFALDPATQAGGGYDDGRVKFGAVSKRSVGVKGGSAAAGWYGSEAKTKTCDFSVRLFSKKHDKSDGGKGKGWKFWHSLPRNWFENTMRKSTSDNYWKFMNGKVFLKKGAKPAMPWGKYGKLSGFDLECHGRTRNDAGKAKFQSHAFLLYERKPGGRNMEARAKKKANGGIKWSYKKH